MSSGLETYPCEVVAVPVGGMTAPARADSEPRMMAVPDTSNTAAGLVLPMPTLLPDS